MTFGDMFAPVVINNFPFNIGRNFYNLQRCMVAVSRSPKRFDCCNEMRVIAIHIPVTKLASVRRIEVYAAKDATGRPLLKS